MQFFNKRTFKIIGIFFGSIYFLAMSFFYFNQEKFFFHPKTLATSYQYQFDTPFEEYDIKVDERNTLNTLLFKSVSPKGVILYLHGNAGALHDWGLRAPLYTNNNYDILFVDYRGFGKNKNEMKNENMLHQDMQHVYDFLKTKYQEKKITIIGFSIGTGLATKLAANNKPQQLILEAPYYSFQTLVHEIAPIVPSFLINYKIKTNEFLEKVNCPITIFHGKQDQLIKPEHGIKLQQINSDEITLHLIENCNHNGIYNTSYYSEKLQQLLN